MADQSHPRHLSLARRVRFFIRDYLSEFGVAWSLARTRDCERNGGHQWGAAGEDKMFGLSRTCGRCGTLETLRKTEGAGLTMTFYADATASTSDIEPEGSGPFGW